MGSDWVMVRVRRKTHAALRAVGESLLRAYEQGKADVGLDWQGNVPLDEVIRILLAQRARHASRRKKAATVRGRRSAAAATNSEAPNGT